jgi:hypothetical protein
MPTNQLYHTWIRRIQELRPKQRITQVWNFVWLMIGIFQSRAVHLRKVVGKIPGKAKLISLTRRSGRLLDNGAIQARDGMNRLPGSGCDSRPKEDSKWS